MATKKTPKTNLKKKQAIPPVKKMIDLTEGKPAEVIKTSPEAKEMYEACNKMARNLLKGSNIPALVEFSRDPNRLMNYFLDRKMAVYLLGANMPLMDRAVINAICNNITTATLGMVNGGIQSYPGIWDYDSLYALCRQFVRISFIDGDADIALLGPYGNDPMITSEKVAEIQKDSPYMILLFSEFNANRLLEFAQAIQSAIMTLIAHEMRNLPLIQYNTKNERITHRYANEFAMVLRPYLEQWKGTTYAQFSDQSDAFVSALGSALETYIGFMLSQSGLSVDAATSAIGLTRWVAHLRCPDGSKDIYTPDSKVLYVVHLVSDDISLPVHQWPVLFSISFRVADVITFTEPSEKITKRVKDIIGRELKTLLTEMVSFAFKAYSMKLIPKEAPKTEE